jgi:hypothetical protein
LVINLSILQAFSTHDSLNNQQDNYINMKSLSFIKKLFSFDKCSDPIYQDNNFQNKSVEEYIEKRVRNKIIFFNCLKNREKHHLRVFQFSIIVIGAAITVVNAILSNESYADILRSIMAILGALVVIFTGIIYFNKYQEKMLSFKITLRTLEKELHLFLLDAGNYSETAEAKDKKSLFIQNIEDILEKEALDYIAIFAHDKPVNRPASGQSDLGRKVIH